MEYKIGRGETGVLTIEPYKSQLLPHWRFKTALIAKESSQILWAKFLEYGDDGNFPGMDMARKFIQMGMTRAQRYANYKGGRKYVSGKAAGDRIEKSKGHEGKAEKEKASLVFREVWERCKANEKYLELKATFLAEQEFWERSSEKEKIDIKEEKSAEGSPSGTNYHKQENKVSIEEQQT